jgi:stage V sporulation protein AA
VIGVLKVVELVEQHYPDCLVQVIGETETIVEEMTGKPSPGWLVNIKVGFVALLCFFGTMYTIMSYHCDVNINMLFGQIYAMVMGRESDGYTVMEAAYSVGLSLGIILFYNHVGKRRLTPDPSPVEVEMRTYEEDVNRSVVETANREERTLDVP